MPWIILNTEGGAVTPRWAGPLWVVAQPLPVLDFTKRYFLNGASITSISRVRFGTGILPVLVLAGVLVEFARFWGAGGFMLLSRGELSTMLTRMLQKRPNLEYMNVYV